ncbi:hypothetical protein EF888_15280 [Silicimonas algicola]|uniref:TTHB210-like domain-containing protein n=1 Tax=Silicimonas algicola TaxID=1826607 RepID=A0A316FY79_9RHOB|nr:DUF5602 domain-containing protein [Silicimonas algicola]AZQ68369.1 hypothetical protein EF888_15280 [Silicimonas algicola]PWK53549.1 hypothetical protein C8D95_11374 [Silicimonas algicola]
MTLQSTLRAALMASVIPLAATAQGIELGPEMPLGEGTARAFTETDAAGFATRIGIEITEEAVASIGQDMIFVTVPLPEAALEAGYDHVSLDWMPHGHAPGALFGVPHFDVHFYMTTEAERLAIDPADPLFMEKAANRPSADLMPPNFVPPPELDPIPAMGEHWLDVTDPVFAGQPFEAVLIYGAWDGELIFVEPMVTRDLLLSRQDFGGALGQPARVDEPLSLPSAWSVSFDAETGVHIVSIDALEARMSDAGAGAQATN